MTSQQGVAPPSLSLPQNPYNKGMSAGLETDTTPEMRLLGHPLVSTELRGCKALYIGQEAAHRVAHTRAWGGSCSVAHLCMPIHTQGVHTCFSANVHPDTQLTTHLLTRMLSETYLALLLHTCWHVGFTLVH